MAVIIVEPENKRIVCGCCGVTVSYTDRDVKPIPLSSGASFILNQDYVTCPREEGGCGSRIIVRDGLRRSY